MLKKQIVIGENVYYLGKWKTYLKFFSNYRKKDFQSRDTTIIK